MFHPPKEWIERFVREHPVEVLFVIAFGFVMLVFMLWIALSSPVWE